jgi:polysaccharide chain length determinant protein (PEP-CTERM system associated)
MIPGKPFKPEDVLTMAFRQRWVILVPFLVIGGATVVVSRFLPNQYQSDAMILVVPQRVPESYVQSTVTTDISDRLQTIKEQILSRTALEKVIQDFNLYPKARETRIMEDVVETFRQNVKVDIARTSTRTPRNRDNDSSFRLSFTYNNPRTTMQVTERLASLFIDENLRDRQVLAEGTNRFMQIQLADARQRLIAQEQRLAEYRVRHSGELPTQTQSNLQVLQNTQMQLQALEDSISRDRDRKMMLERILNETAPAEGTSVPGQAPALTGRSTDRQSPAAAPTTAADRLDAARRELQALELRLKPEHPDVKRLKRTIKDLEVEANAEALRAPVPVAGAPAPLVVIPGDAARASKLNEQRAEFESIDSGIAHKLEETEALKEKLADYQRRLEAGPTREAELVELMRDHDTLQKSYSNLLTKNEESKMAADLERQQIGEQFKVIDSARMPEKPVSPNRPLIVVIGAIAGIGLGVAVGFWREYKDSSLRTDHDVLIALSLPVLAMIPLMMTSAERRRLSRRRWTVALGTGAALVVVIAVAVWKF